MNFPTRKESKYAELFKKLAGQDEQDPSTEKTVVPALFNVGAGQPLPVRSRVVQADQKDFEGSGVTTSSSATTQPSSDHLSQVPDRRQQMVTPGQQIGRCQCASYVPYAVRYGSKHWGIYLQQIENLEGR